MHYTKSINLAKCITLLPTHIYRKTYVNKLVLNVIWIEMISIELNSLWLNIIIGGRGRFNLGDLIWLKLYKTIVEQLISCNMNWALLIVNRNLQWAK